MTKAEAHMEFLAYSRGEISVRAVARKYGVTPSAVSQRFKKIREGSPASAQEVEELREEIAILKQQVQDMVENRSVATTPSHIRPRNLRELVSQRAE
jgi:transposase-like protein